MRITLLAAGAVFAVDQISKALVLEVLRLDRIGGLDVLPPWINFRMGWNTGVNFGLFAADSEALRWGLVALSAVISGLVLYWSAANSRGWADQALAGALIGGAAGNAIDRIRHGAVVDFLNMSCCGIHNPFVFNLADIAIVAAAAGLALRGMAFPPKG